MHRICVVIAVLIFVASQVCLAAEPFTTNVPRVRASGNFSNPLALSFTNFFIKVLLPLRKAT